MTTRKNKEDLATFWERQKEQGTLRQTLGKPIQRGRGRPRSPVPLRPVTLRLADRTVFLVKLLAREVGFPWQRLLRELISDEVDRRLSENRRQREQLSAEPGADRGQHSTTAQYREERIMEAQKLRAVAGSGNIRRLLVPVPAAA